MAIVEMEIHSEFELEDQYTVSGDDLSSIALDIAVAVAWLAIIGMKDPALENETILIGETLMKTLGGIDRKIVKQIYDNSKEISRKILEMVFEEQHGSVMN